MSNRPSMSSEELAAALRGGLESRRRFRAPGPGPAEIAPWAVNLDHLQPLGNLCALPAPPSAGLMRTGVRFARRIARKLMHPWLQHQTHFNNRLLTDLQDRLNHRPDHKFYEAISRLEDRVNECQYRIETLRMESAAAAGPADELLATIGTYILAEMPASDGTILDLSARDAVTERLESLGHSILQAAEHHLAHLPLKPESLRCVLAFDRRLPSSGGIWDAAGWTGRAALRTLLAPGGCVFGARRSIAGPRADEEIARGCAPLRLVDTTVRDGLSLWKAAA